MNVWPRITTDAVRSRCSPAGRAAAGEVTIRPVTEERTDDRPRSFDHDAFIGNDSGANVVVEGPDRLARVILSASSLSVPVSVRHAK